MPKYLIGVNLPSKFSLWNSENFVFVNDINPFLSDRDIWEYARINDFTIVTKDRDFYDRILVNVPPPRVIHVRFGNLKMNAFFQLMVQAWDIASQLSRSHKLVLIYKDSVEGID